MRDAKDLFSASAASLWGTMISHGGVAGFRIPDYQRNYDWSTEKIGRLIEDCANSLASLSLNDESHTFLGTLILVRERSEHTFDGVSLGVVDGQQRLTTLLLACCILSEHLIDSQASIAACSGPTGHWLKAEVEFQLDQLYRCVIGQLPGRARSYPYPRLVRHNDNRAKSLSDAEYPSLIASFLMHFSDFYSTDKSRFEFPGFREDGETSRFRRSYDFIKRQLLFVAGRVDATGDLDCEIVRREDFAKKGLRALFEKLDVLGDDSTKNRALSEVSQAGEHEALIRTLLTSSYLVQRVVLTRVETDDEDAAFDIFDALNTTGEPLTAVETFRPRIIQLSFDKRRDNPTDPRVVLAELDEVLSKRFTSTEAKQSETKDVVVSLALYFDGTKEGRELSAQRRYLRSRFDRLSTQSDRIRFVSALRDTAVFRSRYWGRDAISGLAGDGRTADDADLRLCFAFLSDMNTSLALPPLTRYWAEAEQSGDYQEFTDATKAVTAFLALRRAATGNTSGIDSLFRALMSKHSDRGDPLSLGSRFENTLLPVPLLRARLRDLLSTTGSAFRGKQDWMKLASQVQFATTSKPLSRFLLLAANTYAAPDPQRPGLLTREDVRPTSQRHYLSYVSWTSEMYRTVEHIAPDTDPGSGWAREIYDRAPTRHLLGNLTLLPQAENSRAGNRGWHFKKTFYNALAEEKRSTQAQFFEKAKSDGFTFAAATQKLLKEGHVLHLLDSIRDVEDWDATLVDKRTENLLSLAWDFLEPWLFADVEVSPTISRCR